MHFTLLSVALAVSAPLAAAYPITGTTVNCRTGPGTSYKVVKSYKLNQDVKITCQTRGESIKGDSLWDKTSDNCYVADYYVKTGTTGMVVGECGGGTTPPPTGGNLPTLNALQTKHARAIIAQTKKQGLGRQGCEAAIATGLTESSLRILANRSVPKSLNYKYDGIGSDHDSVGIFQQRAMYYKDIKCDMDAACSASLFFKGMVAVKGWKTMDVAKLCQAVQRSAVPTAYRKYTSAAKSICSAGGI
ncbi:NLP/P60 protein [Pochonia chlamydosporia 170]|uniref:NLP/P60 protein n=1 Tax=Pochonia chlamydosporia 170 TaxID=1380566 RepID=A0A179FH10_METCM|nr:NLP/P60 protein [Pochonia chlamydosporia 170]OAQ64339.1 NLP/P60 protein [Pochonia chlamydosporia 170]